jgi:hypothetical protein
VKLELRAMTKSQRMRESAVMISSTMLVADIFKGDLKLTHCVLLHTGRYAYAARFRDGFEARRDVHTISKDVTAFGDNVTLVDADAIVDAGVRRHASVAFGYPSLHFCRKAQSVDYAPEL